MTKTAQKVALERTQADDRAEAFEAALAENGAPHDGREREILGAILRREAEAVRNVARGLSSSRGGFAPLNDAAVYAAGVADDEARSECDDLTLTQRADLLDAARVLVRIAIEVAG